MGFEGSGGIKETGIYRMRVLLVYPAPDVSKNYRFGYSLLLLYAASDLREHGHEVHLVDFSCEKFNVETFTGLLQRSEALVLEVDAFPLKRSTNIESASRIATLAKERFPNIPIVAIGKQCSLFGRAISFADVTISGDSETYVSKVLKCVERQSYYDAGQINNIDILPVPAYDLLSKHQIEGRTTDRDMCLQPSGLMETSRGCPGLCTFCQRKGWSHGIQCFSDERVLQIFQLLARSGVKNIWVVDENFGANLVRAKGLLKKISAVNDRSKVRLAISSWVRIDHEFLELASEAGVSIISFGIESITKANQDYYHKRVEPDKTAEMISYADSLGLFTVGNFIIGSPLDTEQTIEENLQYAISSGLDTVNVKTLDYMMGAELYQELPAQIRGPIDVRACKELGLCKFTREELKRISANFQNRFRISRIKKLELKTRKYGTPYFEKQEGERSV